MKIRWMVLALAAVALVLATGGALAKPLITPQPATIHLVDGGTDEVTRADRPVLETFYDSELYPIRVHYDEEDEELMWIVLDAAEASWAVQVEEFGWYEPVPDHGHGGSDDIDFYVADSNQDPYLYGAGGYCTSDNWNDCAYVGGRTTCPAYLVINEEMPEYYIQETVAHEFNHALQYSMDIMEDRMFFEATAVYTQGAVIGHTSAWSGFALDYQTQWFMPLDYYDYQGTAFSYGAFIFVQYLAERYGDGTPGCIVELWDMATQTAEFNSNDWMNALEDWLGLYWAEDLDEPGDGENRRMLAWRDFSEWRFFLGAYSHEDYMTGGEPDTATARLPFAETFYFNEIAAGPASKPLAREVGELSTAALEIEPVPAGTPITVQWEDDGSDWKWALTLLQLTPEKDIAEIVVGPIEVGSTELSTTTLEETHQVVALLTVLGDGNYHPNLDFWDRINGTATVIAEGLELPQEDPPEEEEDEGCSCRHDGRASPAPLAGLLTLALWLAIRKRG